MKVNRVFSTLVLTGLLCGATMAAQAQTRLFFGFGGGRGPVVRAQYYRPPCPGPGYVWVGGYYNGPYYVQGYWRRNDDDNYYGRGYYGNHDYYGRGYYGRNYYRGDDDRGWRRRDDWHDRGWHRGRGDDDH